MNNIVISYLTMRKAIGILALLFPFLLIIGALFGGPQPMQPSLSQYYWTTSNILFVSMLVTFGIFLLSYNGYDKRDKIITSIAGIAMMLVAFFPCEGTEVPNYLFMFVSVSATNLVHYVGAALAFSFLGIMAYFQFTLGNSNTPQKKKRNLIYRICGIVIGVAILGMAVVQFAPGVRESTDVIKLFFWLESIVVWAFGVSWLIKGETLLTDK